MKYCQSKWPSSFLMKISMSIFQIYKILSLDITQRLLLKKKKNVKFKIRYDVDRIIFWRIEKRSENNYSHFQNYENRSILTKIMTISTRIVKHVTRKMCTSIVIASTIWSKKVFHYLMIYEKLWSLFFVQIIEIVIIIIRESFTISESDHTGIFVIDQNWHFVRNP